VKRHFDIARAAKQHASLFADYAVGCEKKILK